ncbi:MAG: N-6 DNA methylase [Patescibacteria group bacterium]|jgi:predicted RNA methylase
MVKAERYTENLVERDLRKAGFDEDDFQFQGSYDEEIRQFLPSKRSGKVGRGKSEFIVRLNGDAADLLVIECKNDQSLHASKSDLNENSKLEPVKYAEDGVMFYMKGLRKDFNVIGLAVSGTESLTISTFKALRQSKIERLPNDVILSPSKYLDVLRETKGYGYKTDEEISSFAKKLHDFLRDNMELSEAYKPLIVSGILLALMDNGFESSYRRIPNGEDLAEALLEAIKRTLKWSKIKDEKLEAMCSNYHFIKADKAVRRYLSTTVAKIYRNLFFALQPTNGIDLLGNFYGEFLKYSGGDKKGLGIVLTPKHITELFADLAELNPNESVVIDPCAGTGGFLISAMANMIRKSKDNPETIKRIKEKSLIGIELNSHMFTLACANMIFRGDGKANMFWDDCLSIKDKTTANIICLMKPNVALLNPPYSKKGEKKHELAFVLKALDFLQPNSICVAIIPMSCVIEDDKVTLAFKKKLLERHTLVSVMSMPEQLFPSLGSVAVSIVFIAHKPNIKSTWFANWKDDGFKLKKNKRIEKSPGIWNKIKEDWLKTCFNQEVIPSYSCKRKVDYKNEWCSEEYLDIDYSILSKEYFEHHVYGFAKYAFFALDTIAKFDKKPMFDRVQTISNWGEFELQKLFSFESAKGPSTDEAISNSGYIPFVSAGGRNNGVIGLTKYKPTHPFGAISLVIVGAGASGEAFLQPHPFCANPGKCLVLTNDKISLPAKLFISASITSQEWRFCYGRACTTSRAKCLKIPLPIDKKGDPDFDLMSKYIYSCRFSGIFDAIKGVVNV